MAPEGGFSSFVTWRRIRARAGLDDVRIHDLRLTYDSNAVMSGLSIPILGKILGKPPCVMHTSRMIRCSKLRPKSRRRCLDR
jgi:hypothetical protein